MSALDDIQARADAASEGPWHEYYVPNIGGRPEDYQYGDWIIDSEKTLIASTRIWTERGEKDSLFISYAREDVPKLVATLRAVQAIALLTSTSDYNSGWNAALDTIDDTIREALS